jgi:hypothetical protein
MSLSKQYKQYQARARKQGKTPISFEAYQAMADVRAQRGNGASNGRSTANGRSTSAVAVVERQKARNGRKTQPAPKQRDAHFTISDPDALATGRQLWKLNELGLLDQFEGRITKGEASEALDEALS